MCWVFGGVDLPVAHLSISGMILLSVVSRRCWQGASLLHKLILMYLLFQLVAALCRWRTCSTGGGMTKTRFLLGGNIALLRVTPMKFAVDMGTPSSSGRPRCAVS